MDRKRVLLMAGLAFLTQVASANGPRITWVQPAANEGRTYERVDMEFTVDGDFSNPFDARQVAVDLVIEHEAGETIRIPGFYYRDYKRFLTSSSEFLVPAGDPVWKARFAPPREGNYQYWLEATDRQGTSRSAVMTFAATKGNNPGFVRVAADGAGFVFDDGSPYFPVGINLAHPHDDSGTYAYDLYLKAMGEANLNWTRLWMAPPWRSTAVALEWTDKQFPSEYGRMGLGRYSLQAAWRIDHFVDTAAEFGIYVMLCFGDERELEATTEPSRAFWPANPYNKANGGPLLTPNEFFTNKEARAAYKNRLRYIVGRWGYSTNVIWEFWNEINHPKVWGNTWAAKRGGVTRWHQEMAEYLRDIDPYRHLISTSFVGGAGEPQIWLLPEMDFTQVHTYNLTPDATQVVLNLAARHREQYQKPVLISEIGTGGTSRFAPQGGPEEVAIHNALWASVFSEAAGAPIWWYWREIHRNGYYDHYAILTRFLEDVPAYQFAPVKAEVTPSEGVLALAAVGPVSTAVWVHNREHNWTNVENAKTAIPVCDVRVSIPNVQAGLYEVTQLDPWTGRYTAPKQVRVDSVLALEVGQLERDVAFKALRLGD